MTTTAVSNKKRNHTEVSSAIPHVHGSYGPEPLEYLPENKHTAVFAIHNFAELPQKRNEWIATTTVQVSGHPFRLMIYPRGHKDSKTDTEIVSIYLSYKGESTEANPVNVQYRFRSNTALSQFGEHKFTKKKNSGGCKNCKKRNDIIRKDLDSKGTLTIEVDITIGTPQREIWFPKISPQMNDDTLGPILYRSMDTTSDVTFCVGSSMVEMKTHGIILSLRAPVLYEMISTGGTSTVDEDIVLQDIDSDAFQAMLEFIYTNKLPTMKSYNGDEDAEESLAKSIVTVADRFGCTPLKLYAESCITQDILHPGDFFRGPNNVAQLLLFADSYSCALLKEACMRMYVTDPASVQRSCDEDWNRLKESNDLLVELLNYGTYPGRRKKYVSVLVHNDGTINDADSYDVTSLRERLEKYQLDTDGSHEMLLQRWKDHLLVATAPVL